MSVARFSILGVALLSLTAASYLFATPSAEKERTSGAGEGREETGLRQVGMKILLDDQVLWEAGTSDDGRPNADAVWTSLKEARFQRGRDFAANEPAIQHDGDDATVKGDVTVHVDYGGEKAVHELTLKRVVTETGERWAVPEELVDKWFWSRTLSRRHAGDLPSLREGLRDRAD